MKFLPHHQRTSRQASPSSRGRGLKSQHSHSARIAIVVALFTRAWIEISSSSSEDFTTSVALFTRAWIEISPFMKNAPLKPVALFTRAWIEIAHNSQKSYQKNVALFTRAWIEMQYLHTLILSILSPSSRGRGLKSPFSVQKNRLLSSPSSRGRGLKFTASLALF